MQQVNFILFISSEFSVKLPYKSPYKPRAYNFLMGVALDLDLGL